MFGVDAVRRAVGKHHDIPGMQGDRFAAVFKPSLPFDDHVIRRDARLFRRMLDHPGRGEVAAHFERSAQRVQGEQATQSVHGGINK